MKNKKKKIKGLNEGHYVEAIDRAYIIAEIIENVLVEHPVFEKHKKLMKKVKKAQQHILDAYQMIGGLSVDLFPDPAQQADKK